MRLVLQRVSSAAVSVAGSEVARIDRGVLVLAGIARDDTEESVERAAAKVAVLRLFEDAAGRMNLDAAAADAEFLVVSQFTLAADLERGRRPSFGPAAPPERAAPLVERLVAELRRRGLRVATGSFGKRMAVELVNDGPVTFVLDF